jgi:hypothetical protein
MKVSHEAVWSWVRKKWPASRREGDQRWKAVFEDGDLFEGDGKERDCAHRDGCHHAALP